MNWLFDKLKKRWGVKTVWQLIIILVIFTVTGVSTLYVKKLIFDLIGFTPDTPFWLRAMVWLLTVVPSYQLLFLFYGFILGQFEFVWRFEKKTIERVKSLWSK